MLAREHSRAACVASPSLTHLVGAPPRWELGWPPSPSHAEGLLPPLSPHHQLSFNSHHPFSRVSNVKPISGSQDLLPTFSCPGDSIVPSASDAVTLLILQEEAPTTFTAAVSSVCSRQDGVGFRYGSERRQLVTNFLRTAQCRCRGIETLGGPGSAQRAGATAQHVTNRKGVSLTPERGPYLPASLRTAD